MGRQAGRQAGRQLHRDRDRERQTDRDREKMRRTKIQWGCDLGATGYRVFFVVLLLGGFPCIAVKILH